MLKFSLRFVPDDQTSETTLSFNAHSTAGALDAAKRVAEGNWADLYQGNDLICRLQLAEENGLWRVISANTKSGC
ncbi:hypothetical protein [Erythrobacter sp. THAF29]|uniref:hypothetical protein n=1 Tax=Erythrobacter sp. THAF29 TaxID=2587851 RepID=UPI001268C077|nr:hypothetical protein [Erythrobacter sp. THAF29]QFT76119.1 hypothetical protein FIU90_01055 [Erythrobacter sp. THAF29]